MKKVIFLCTAILLVIINGCPGPSESKNYTHAKARFTVTCPAGWSLITEDNEIYEFRRGDVKLIEVGGFVFGEDIEAFREISEAEYREFIRVALLDGLDGYCEEAEISDWTIEEQNYTTWGGMDAYQVQAQGFSDAADVDMVLDLLLALNLENGMLYMFASQIEKSQYDNTKTDVTMTIQSFQPQ